MISFLNLTKFTKKGKLLWFSSKLSSSNCKYLFCCYWCQFFVMFVVHLHRFFKMHMFVWHNFMISVLGIGKKLFSRITRVGNHPNQKYYKAFVIHIHWDFEDVRALHFWSIFELIALPSYQLRSFESLFGDTFIAMGQAITLHRLICNCFKQACFIIYRFQIPKLQISNLLTFHFPEFSAYRSYKQTFIHQISNLLTFYFSEFSACRSYKYIFFKRKFYLWQINIVVVFIVLGFTARP